MTQLTVYADATALIGLARIDRLDLLRLLPCPIHVTAHVWEEITSFRTKPGVAALHHARESGLLTVVEEGDPDAFPQLDSGESSVLTAAVAKGAAVIIDECKARALLRTDPGLNGAIKDVTGIVGLILLAKRRGKISAVRPLLEGLVAQNFWLSAGFFQAVLRQAGEL